MPNLCSLVVALTSVLSANGLELVPGGLRPSLGTSPLGPRGRRLQRLNLNANAVLERQWLVGGWHLWPGSW